LIYIIYDDPGVTAIVSYQLFTYYDAMCAINKNRFVDYICCLYMAY